MTTPRLTPERLAEARAYAEKVTAIRAARIEMADGELRNARTFTIALLAELDAVRGELEQWKAKARAIAQDRAEVWEQVGALEKHAADTEQQIEALNGELAELRSASPAPLTTSDETLIHECVRNYGVNGVGDACIQINRDRLRARLAELRSVTPAQVDRARAELVRRFGAVLVPIADDVRAALTAAHEPQETR